MKFKCDTLVTGFKFYADGTGTVCISLWAPEGTFNIKLVGKTSAVVETAGIKMYFLDDTEYFTAFEGYFMGIHYPSRSEGGLIPYYYSTFPLHMTPYNVVNLSDVYNPTDQDPDLLLGSIREISITEFKRLAPVVFISEGKCICH